VKHHENSPPGLGAALVCALLAQIVNVLLAAVLAAQVPGGYRVRSWVFVAALLWGLAGTVLLLIRTAAGAGRSDAKPVHVGRIALWLVSSWVWPVLVLRQRPASQREAPR
jgi:hypothetical protein